MPVSYRPPLRFYASLISDIDACALVRLESGPNGLRRAGTHTLDLIDGAVLDDPEHPSQELTRLNSASDDLPAAVGTGIEESNLTLRRMLG